MRLDYKFYLGLLVGVVFLYLALHKVDFVQMALVFSRIRWPLIIVALVLYYLTYVARMFRWKLLMAPIKDTRYRNLFSAVAIGFGANNMFPVRLGELVRAYSLGKMEKVRTSAVLATVVIERVFDILTVLGMLVVVLFFVTFPEAYGNFMTGLRAAGIASLVAMAVFISFLVLLEKNRDRAMVIVRFFSRPLPERFRLRIESMITSFADGLNILYHGRKLVGIVFFSVLLWLVIAAFYWVILFSFDISLPFMAAVFVTVLIAFAVSLPAPPGYIGTFHAAARYALVFYALPASEAAGIGIVMHALNFIPAIAGGLLFIWLDKMSFAEMTHVKEEQIKG
ncbi:MAG: flippase-like domain-containing protein [Deltaproteobacteria bacterium]|nr:flippase-like domain-containing protein [Candidatus Zymogenaceae bacterium]